MAYNIGVDINGSDNGPKVIIEGALAALNLNEDIIVTIFGDEAVITEKLGKDYDKNRINIVHAPDAITNYDSPTEAVRKKKDASVVKAMEYLSEKKIDGVVSAGSTGAVLTAATLIARRIEGVKRPALAPIMPTVKGPMLLIDCGANNDCKPDYLEQFALMGSIYMKHLFNLENPRVALINNGAEAGKGNALTKEAYKLIEKLPINFVGNLEPRYLLEGTADVAVCDGFIGNMVLKTTEGVALTLFSIMKKEFLSNTRSKLGAALLKPALKNIKSMLDYTEHGGAVLLGINGGVIKGHGTSDPKSIRICIEQARDFAKCGIVDEIKQDLSGIE